MKTKQLLKEIKDVFILPKRKYYLGRIKYHTPYFLPINFNPMILSIRKLKLKSQEEIDKYFERYPHFKNSLYEKNSYNIKFSNFPMVTRSNYWAKKIFNQYYYITVGWPVKIAKSDLGWKDKYNSPKFEWNPFWMIFFFKWQFCIHWIPPFKDLDQYWEQVLWYLHYSDKDIKKAKEIWPWTNFETGVSTWNNKYLKQ